MKVFRKFLMVNSHSGGYFLRRHTTVMDVFKILFKKTFDLICNQYFNSCNGFLIF